MTISPWVYLDGHYVSVNEARISPFDRGFLFAHAAYEVTAVFAGAMIDFVGHNARLERTLDGICLANPHDQVAWKGLHDALIAKNELQEGLVYLQVSGGAYGGRDFAGPDILTPTVFMFSVAKPILGENAKNGIAAITLPDTRWARRDLKTTQLLSQALAYRSAKEGGQQTAIMHEDGLVTEAASANIWIVTQQGEVITRELSRAILPGITRAAVLSSLQSTGVPVVESAFSLGALSGAREVFATSAGALIAPIIEIDGKAVGDGKPGPITRQVQRSYYQAMGADLGERAPWL